MCIPSNAILYSMSHFVLGRLMAVASQYMAYFHRCKSQDQLNQICGYRLLKWFILSDVFTICIIVYYFAFYRL